MPSLWTDLLFLHGHLLHKDLAWLSDTQPTTTDAHTAAVAPTAAALAPRAPQDHRESACCP
jgi:hypothetical protein